MESRTVPMKEKRTFLCYNEQPKTSHFDFNPMVDRKELEKRFLKHNFIDFKWIDAKEFLKV